MQSSLDEIYLPNLEAAATYYEKQGLDDFDRDQFIAGKMNEFELYKTIVLLFAYKAENNNFPNSLQELTSKNNFIGTYEKISPDEFVVCDTFDSENVCFDTIKAVNTLMQLQHNTAVINNIYINAFSNLVEGSVDSLAGHITLSLSFSIPSDVKKFLDNKGRLPTSVEEFFNSEYAEKYEYLIEVGDLEVFYLDEPQTSDLFSGQFAAVYSFLGHDPAFISVDTNGVSARHYSVEFDEENGTVKIVQ